MRRSLKKRFNGMILKGQKIRIEDANLEQKHVDAEDGDQQEPRPAKRAKKEKKESSKYEEPPLPGVELPDKRKVKRGWTESAAEKRERKVMEKELDAKKDKTSEEKKNKKKDRQASKFTKDAEMLFKTKLPPNAAASEAAADEAKSKKKKKSKKEGNEVLVHEFAKRKHLKDDDSTPAEPHVERTLEYVDGKGWVNETGRVIEPATTDRKLRPRPSPQPKAKQKPASKLDDKPVAGLGLTLEPPTAENGDSSEVSSSDTSSASESSEDEVENSNNIVEAPKIVHPLEALYKRPKPGAKSSSKSPTKPPPIDTSFSFFEAGTEGGSEDAGEDASEKGTRTLLLPPLTPHTKRDIRFRGVRSAAPTPDTAALNRKFSFSMIRRSDDDNDDDSDDSDDDDSIDVRENTKLNAVDEAATTADADPGSPSTARPAADGANGDKAESAFAQEFWEQRGPLNKAWRARRKDAMKQKRKRENKRLTRRMV